MNRKPIFDAVRKLLDRPFTQPEVDALDEAIDLATSALPATTAPEPTAPEPASVPDASGRTLGAAGAKLIKKWEGCERHRADGKFDAYPDPGSADGKPWTIGWGSTGPDIRKGTVWTQAQCDERFDEDMKSYVGQVAHFIGDTPTTQNQFDALVSFQYNTGAIASSTLGKLHKQGKFEDAQREFAKWIFNNHKPMAGLKARRADEAKLYGTP
ncbi:GH24 family phage-related lysozyme (muramidase) [Novosphingobium sp. PhB165]|uniref:lysozyme n=1 Tax=Novosphingobium sp. PhB165 TaxID=2485105 RepID=UPI00104C0ED5|nr:lysozyme [Novosphingobium sp. PhB165]TCM19853.1 GH24 family phage-related lysozyme (muramidase) [Novosphingobium sp. PhB165]